MAKRLWDKGESLHPEILAYTVGNDYVLDLDLVEEDCWGAWRTAECSPTRA